MRNLKKVLAVILVMVMAFSAMPVLAASGNEITVTIDGVPVVFEGQGPIIQGGRTLVPVRGVFEALDFYPTWNPATGVATLTRDDFVIVLTIGSHTFTTNGESFSLDVPPQIIAGRTLLPLRAVLESIGIAPDALGFDPVTRVVTIETGIFVPGYGEPLHIPRYERASELFGLEIVRLTYDSPDFAGYMHVFNYEELRGHDFDYPTDGTVFGDTLMITTDVPLSQFAVVDMRPDISDDGYTLYDVYPFMFGGVADFLPGQAYVIHSYIGVGTLPWSAITFFDQYGTRWYFAIIQNQAYGNEGTSPYVLLCITEYIVQ